DPGRTGKEGQGATRRTRRHQTRELISYASSQNALRPYGGSSRAYGPRSHQLRTERVRAADAVNGAQDRVHGRGQDAAMASNTERRLTADRQLHVSDGFSLVS